MVFTKNKSISFKLISLVLVFTFLWNDISNASGGLKDCLAPHTTLGQGRIELVDNKPKFIIDNGPIHPHIALTILFRIIADSLREDLDLNAEDVKKLINETLGQFKDTSLFKNIHWDKLEKEDKAFYLPIETSNNEKLKLKFSRIAGKSDRFKTQKDIDIRNTKILIDDGVVGVDLIDSAKPQGQPDREEINPLLVNWWKFFREHLKDKVKIDGLDNFPKKGNFIIAGNHISPVAVTILPNAVYEGYGILPRTLSNKEQISELTSLLVDAGAGYYINGLKPEEVTHMAAQVLKDPIGRHIVGIYPSGRVLKSPEHYFWSGSKTGHWSRTVGYIAKEADVPIVPFALYGSLNPHWKVEDFAKLEGNEWVLHEESEMPAFRLHVRFGEPIPPDFGDETAIRDELLKRSQELYKTMEEEEQSVATTDTSSQPRVTRKEVVIEGHEEFRAEQLNILSALRPWLHEKFGVDLSWTFPKEGHALILSIHGPYPEEVLQKAFKVIAEICWEDFTDTLVMSKRAVIADKTDSYKAKLSHMLGDEGIKETKAPPASTNTTGTELHNPYWVLMFALGVAAPYLGLPPVVGKALIIGSALWAAIDIIRRGIKIFKTEPAALTDLFERNKLFPGNFNVLKYFLKQAFSYIFSFMMRDDRRAAIRMTEVDMAASLADRVKPETFKDAYDLGGFERSKTTHQLSSISWRPTNSKCGIFGRSTSMQSWIASLILDNKVGSVLACVWQLFKAGTVATRTPSSSRSMTTKNLFRRIYKSLLRSNNTISLPESQVYHFGFIRGSVWKTFAWAFGIIGYIWFFANLPEIASWLGMNAHLVSDSTPALSGLDLMGFAPLVWGGIREMGDKDTRDDGRGAKDEKVEGQGSRVESAPAEPESAAAPEKTQPTGDSKPCAEPKGPASFELKTPQGSQLEDRASAQTERGERILVSFPIDVNLAERFTKFQNEAGKLFDDAGFGEMFNSESATILYEMAGNIYRHSEGRHGTLDIEIFSVGNKRGLRFIATNPVAIFGLSNFFVSRGELYDAWNDWGPFHEGLFNMINLSDEFYLTYKDGSLSVNVTKWESPLTEKHISIKFPTLTDKEIEDIIAKIKEAPEENLKRLEILALEDGEVGAAARRIKDAIQSGQSQSFTLQCNHWTALIAFISMLVLAKSAGYFNEMPAYLPIVLLLSAGVPYLVARIVKFLSTRSAEKPIVSGKKILPEPKPKPSLGKVLAERLQSDSELVEAWKRFEAAMGESSREVVEEIINVAEAVPSDKNRYVSNFVISIGRLGEVEFGATSEVNKVPHQDIKGPGKYGLKGYFREDAGRLFLKFAPPHEREEFLKKHGESRDSKHYNALLRDEVIKVARVIYSGFVQLPRFRDIEPIPIDVNIWDIPGIHLEFGTISVPLSKLAEFKLSSEKEERSASEPKQGPLLEPSRDRIRGTGEEGVKREEEGKMREEEIKPLGKIIAEEAMPKLPAKLVELEAVLPAEAEANPNALILYAEDTIDAGINFDIGETLSNQKLQSKKILTNGKIFLYVKEREKTDKAVLGLKAIIERADNTIEVLIIDKNDLNGNLKSDSNEMKALKTYACNLLHRETGIRPKDENILGIFRNPNGDMHAMPGISKDLKVPVIMFKGFGVFSFAEALKEALIIRQDKKDWYKYLEPVRPIIEYTVEEFRRYVEEVLTKA